MRRLRWCPRREEICGCRRTTGCETETSFGVSRVSTWRIETSFPIWGLNGLRPHFPSPFMCVCNGMRVPTCAKFDSSPLFMRIAACADMASSGLNSKTHQKPYTCAELKSYCDHATFGKILKKRCPKTCDTCPTGAQLRSRGTACEKSPRVAFWHCQTLVLLQ